MQNRERHSPNETQQTLLRPLGESSKILNAITAMSLRLGKPMSGERMEQLLTDLGPYPLAAIEYALDSWGRNAKVMPTLSDLLALLRSYMADRITVETCGNCDTGWVRGFKDKAGNDAVKRCECMSR